MIAIEESLGAAENESDRLQSTVAGCFRFFLIVYGTVGAIARFHTLPQLVSFSTGFLRYNVQQA